MIGGAFGYSFLNISSALDNARFNFMLPILHINKKEVDVKREEEDKPVLPTFSNLSPEFFDLSDVLLLVAVTNVSSFASKSSDAQATLCFSCS